jgi:regulator of nonsense transcripts 2
MKSKQEAEREEQQRIKNLVLNLDLGDDSQNDGILYPELIFQRPLNKSAYAKGSSPRIRTAFFVAQPHRQTEPPTA